MLEVRQAMIAAEHKSLTMEQILFFHRTQMIRNGTKRFIGGTQIYSGGTHIVSRGTGIFYLLVRKNTHSQPWNRPILSIGQMEQMFSHFCSMILRWKVLKTRQKKPKH